MAAFLGIAVAVIMVAVQKPPRAQAGVLAAIGLVVAAALLAALFTDPRHRDRRRLRRVPARLTPPDENGCIALRGRVRAVRTLTSPVGGSACIYYWTTTNADGHEPYPDKGGESVYEFELVCSGQAIAIDIADAVVMMSRGERSAAARWCREYVILPDDEVIVMGYYQLAPEPGAFRGTPRMSGGAGKALVIATPRALTEKIVS